MAEPRSISFGTPAHPTISADRWLTDSRVYNLIWLGRWLERAENVARVIMAASQVAIQQGSDNQTFQQSLHGVAATWGIAIADPDQSLRMLLRDHETSSIHHSIFTARSTATQVGTVELIRAISDVLLKLGDDTIPLNSPAEAQEFSGAVLAGLDQVYRIIDDSWFHREPLSEEEVYRRFVQQ